MRTWKYRCKASKHVVYYGTAFIFDNCVKCKSFKSWWMNNKVQGHWIWICSLANIFSLAYRNLTAAELWQWQRTFCASLYAETSFNVNYRNIQHRNSLLSKQQWNWSVIFVYLPLSCMKLLYAGRLSCKEHLHGKYIWHSRYLMSMELKLFRLLK